MRKLVVVLASLYTAGAAAMLGLLSNWFRYGLSLEGTVVAVSIALSGLIVLVIAIIAFKKQSRSLIVGLCAAILSSVLTTVATHRSAFGSWLPPFYLCHLETSGYATLAAHGQVLRYGLELRNPFSKAHREYLVVNWKGEERRIQLPIFEGIPGGYASATQPKDWVVLHPTENDNVYDVEIVGFLSKKRFRVNMKTSEVTILSKALDNRLPNNPLNQTSADNARAG